VRRRLWGTDQPPGQENPYGESSALEQYKSEESKRVGVEEEDAQGHELEPTQSPAPIPTYDAELGVYEPASTWDGLDVIGDVGEKEFYFGGFLPEKRVESKNEAIAALHQAVVEVFALKQADKPLSILRDSGGVNLTSEVQIKVSPSTAPEVVLEFPKSVPKAQLLEYLALVDKLVPGPDAAVSEENVAEDTWEDIVPNTNSEDLLAKGQISQNSDYHAQAASWDPIWFQISLDDPEVKFAVSDNNMLFWSSANFSRSLSVSCG
jgi:hypothetical protein